MFLLLLCYIPQKRHFKIMSSIMEPVVSTENNQSLEPPLESQTNGRNRRDYVHEDLYMIVSDRVCSMMLIYHCLSNTTNLTMHQTLAKAK